VTLKDTNVRNNLHQFLLINQAKPLISLNYSNFS